MTDDWGLEASLLVLFNTYNNDQEDSKENGNEYSRLEGLETWPEIASKMQSAKS